MCACVRGCVCAYMRAWLGEFLTKFCSYQFPCKIEFYKFCKFFPCGNYTVNIICRNDVADSYNMKTCIIIQ